MSKEKKLCRALYKIRQKYKQPSEAFAVFMARNPEYSEHEATKIYDSFDRGFKAGVNSVITNGGSDAVTYLGQDAMFYAAHEFGKKEFKRLSAPLPIKLGQVLMILLVLFGIAYAVYHF